MSTDEFDWFGVYSRDHWEYRPAYQMAGPEHVHTWVKDDGSATARCLWCGESEHGPQNGLGRPRTRRTAPGPRTPLRDGHGPSAALQGLTSEPPTPARRTWLIPGVVRRLFARHAADPGSRKSRLEAGSPVRRCYMCDPCVGQSTMREREAAAYDEMKRLAATTDALIASRTVSPQEERRP